MIYRFQKCSAYLIKIQKMLLTRRISNFMVFASIIVISMLFSLTVAQAQCTINPLPITFPVVYNNDNLTIDLSQYFSGNNLTYSILPQHRQIFVRKPIQKLYNFSSYNLGTIVSTDGWQIIERKKQINNFNVSIMVRNDKKQYVLYYGNIQTWENQFSKKVLGVESQIGNCFSHVMDQYGNFVVHCSSKTTENQNIWGSLEQTKMVQLIFGNAIQETLIFKRFPLLSDDPMKVKLIMLSDVLLIRAYLVPDLSKDSKLPENTYFELWDLEQHQMIGIYDRTFFGKIGLSLMDISEGGIPLSNSKVTHQLFLLDYQTGIFKLILNQQRILLISGFEQVEYFEKLAVFKERTIISSGNSVIQINDNEANSKIIKYQTSNSQILNLFGNQDYTIVKCINQIVIFKKGIISPFYIMPLSSPFTQILLFSNVMILVESSYQSITLSPYIFHPQNLHIQMVTSSVNITVAAFSKVFASQARCNSSTQIVVLLNYEEQAIFKNIYNIDANQIIYVNRPGSTQIDLNRYASGSNLTYEIISFNNKLDFIYEISKVNASVVKIDNTATQPDFLLNSVNSAANIVRLQFENFQVFYLQCVMTSDKNIYQNVECKKSYVENIKVAPASIKYVTFQSSNPFFPSIVYESIISQPTVITIRKFSVNGFTNPEFICSISYPVVEAKVYNIDSVDIFVKNDESLGIFVVLSKRKQIHYYQYSSYRQDQGCTLLRTIGASDISSVSQLFYPQQIQIIREQTHTEEIHTESIYNVQILVKQFNQIYILTMDINNLDDIKKPLKVFKANSIIVKDGATDGSYGIEVQYPNILIIQTNQTNNNSQSRNIDRLNENQKQILRVYKIQQQNSLKFSHDLPTYGQQLNGFYGKIPKSSLITIGVVDKKNTEKVAIYDLKALTSFYSYYGEDSQYVDGYGPMQTNSLKLKQFSSLIKVQQMNSPILANFPIRLPKSGMLSSYIIHSSPQLKLALVSNSHSSQSQQFYIRIMNTNDSVRHLVTLKIANYPENITYGNQYPFSSKTYNIQETVTIETSQWFKGNVIKYDFSCSDCLPKLFGADPLIHVYDKVHKRKHIPSYNGHQSILVNGVSYVLKGKNLVYTIDLESGNIGKSYVIPTNSQCSNMAMADSFYLQNQLLLVLCGRQLFGISLISESSKSNIVINYLLPTFGLDMYYHKSVVGIIGLDGTYLISIPNNLNIKVLDYIDKNQLGNICAIDFLRTQTQDLNEYNSYTSLFTNSDQGFWLIKFRVQKGTVISYSQKQKISIANSLSALNLNIPSNSKFINSVITNYTVIKEGLIVVEILTIIDRFSSFQWQMQVINNFADDLVLTGVLNRYGNYEKTGKASFKDNYIMLQMFKDQDFIYGLYDRKDYSLTSQNEHDQSLYEGQVKYYYIIQASPNHKKASFQIVSMQGKQFQTVHQMVSTSYSQNQLSIYQISNTIRLNVTNYQQIQSQSLLLIPSTNYTAKSLSVKLKGLQYFVFQWWLIILIVIFSIIFIALLIFLTLYLIRYIKQKRKLVPLLTDYMNQDGQFQYENEQEEKKIQKQIQAIKNKNSSSSGFSSSGSDSSSQERKNKNRLKQESLSSSSLSDQDMQNLGVINPSVRGSV